MNSLHQFLNELKQQKAPKGRFLGLLHLLVGRRIARADGALIANGLSWREAARHLKKVRWDPEAVRDLGLDPASLPPRDRERYWYQAIARAGVDSPAASAQADRLAHALRPLGYIVRPSPTNQ